MNEVLGTLARLPNVEDLYEVSGDFDIVSLVSAANIEEIRDLPNNKVRKIPGIKSAMTSIILNAKRDLTNSPQMPTSQ